MFTKSYKYYTAVAIATMALSFTSCQKALDLLPEDRVDQTNMYQTLADADAAVLGIYGQLAGLGEKYIVLNELRADLVDVTRNAGHYLQELSVHEVSEDNPYADPTAFYRIILNCNDALKNFKIMADQGKLAQEDYIQRYSDILTVRTWLYLQLGIHFGQVPYFTETIESVDEIQQLNELRRLSFDELIDRLVLDVQDIPYKSAYAYPTGSSLLFTTDGYNTNKVFISKPHVLGELYLWKGDYYEAAKWYKIQMMAEDNNTNNAMQLNANRLDNFATLYVKFLNNRGQDPSALVNSLTDGWRSMFGRSNNDAEWNYEWNWFIPYHNDFAPGNPFIDLVSKEGAYKIKPSQKIIDLWNAQTLTSGIPWDARGRMSYEIAADGDPVITKLTDNAQEALSLLNRGGQWKIFRQAGLHLRFAEAANRDGHGRLGYALLNQGIRSAFYYGSYSSGGGNSPSPQSFFELESQITHEGFGSDRVTYPESSPYYFDANDRNGLWRRNGGIRGRAMLPRHELPGMEYVRADEVGYTGVGPMMSAFNVDKDLLEDKLIEEAALELAFEGNRWSDLTRIARRRNDPAYLADKIYEKLLKANDPRAGEVRSKLMNPENWYLPFKVN